MRLLWMACTISVLFSTSAIAQPPQVPPPNQQIAAAVLPLPEVMRANATYSAKLPTCRS